MTPLPKRRLSHKRQGKRRAAINLAIAKLGVCKNCHKPVQSHRACKYCGHYT